MQQVLFWIRLHSLADWLPDIPIYGYGTMLFVAFVCCTWLLCRLGTRQGYPRERLQDLAIWIFITGILGARITYMIEERDQYATVREFLLHFFRIWDGGLVFYGSFFGGTVGFFLTYFWFLRKHGIDAWKLADIIAPCLALGLCLGRVGCLLNGCCWGEVACPGCLANPFPFSSPPRGKLVERGLQTPAGFTMAGPGSTQVGNVEPDSPAAHAGLRAGDRIIQIDGMDMVTYRDIASYLVTNWPRGKNTLQLTVRHANEQEEELPPFAPWTLGLYPTQIYESISMALLLFVLLACYPLKKRHGSVLALFMACYAVHRFLNEMLRGDNPPAAFDLTLSQNISVLLLLAAAVLVLVIRFRRPGAAAPAPAMPGAA